MVLKGGNKPMSGFEIMFKNGDSLKLEGCCTYDPCDIYENALNFLAVKGDASILMASVPIDNIKAIVNLISYTPEKLKKNLIIIMNMNIVIERGKYENLC